MRRPVEEYVLNKIEREEKIAQLMLALRFAGLTVSETRVFIASLLEYSTADMCVAFGRDRSVIVRQRKSALRKVQRWLNGVYGAENVPQFAETWYYQGAA